MQTPDLASVDFREDATLPQKTIVAPLPIIREIRIMLGNINLHMLVGTDDAVLVSSDVFLAFSQWDAAQEEFDGDDAGPGTDCSNWN